MLYEEILTQLEKDFDEFEYLDLIDFNSKLQIINRLDKTLKKISKIKCENSSQILQSIKSSKIPNEINQNKITLFSLLLYFQKNMY